MGCLPEAVGGVGGLRVESTNLSLCTRTVYACTCKVLKMSRKCHVSLILVEVGDRFGDRIQDRGPAEWQLFWIQSEHVHVSNIILRLMEN